MSKIDDMSNLNEPEITKEEKKKKEEIMNEEKFNVDDMALDNTEKPEKLDMDLEGPDPLNIGLRIAKTFPDVDLIDLDDDFKILKMADSSYTVKGKSLKELASVDLQKIDELLKSKGG